MIIKTSHKSAILLILSSSFILGCSPDNPLQTLTDNRAALATGINFVTTKVVALNPENGSVVPACIKPGDNSQVSRTTEKSSTDVDSKCNVELVINDNTQALRTALELSKQPIQGEIKKNGEIKPARFVVTVTALYEGSDCNGVYSGGDQVVNCTKPKRRP